MYTYVQTYIACIRRDCQLAHDATLNSILACAGRKLTLLESSVDCLLRHGSHVEPRHLEPQPEWYTPPTGFAPRVDFDPTAAYPKRNLGHDPFEARTNLRSPGYPNNIESFGRPNIRQSNYGQATNQQFAPNQRGQIARAVIELMLSELSR